MSTAAGVSFRTICTLAGLPAPEAEYRVLSTRKWRFDWAWPVPGVALEVEGGTFLAGGSRHTRGAGYRADLEKYNEAAVAGWVVLRCLPEQLASMATIDLVRRALESRGWAPSTMHERAVALEHKTRRTTREI